MSRIKLQQTVVNNRKNRNKFPSFEPDGGYEAVEAVYTGNKRWSSGRKVVVSAANSQAGGGGIQIVKHNTVKKLSGVKPAADGPADVERIAAVIPGPVLGSAAAGCSCVPLTWSADGNGKRPALQKITLPKQTVKRISMKQTAVRRSPGNSAVLRKKRRGRKNYKLFEAMAQSFENI